MASIAAELQFRSLSRHSSPTEERDGTCVPAAFLPSLPCLAPPVRRYCLVKGRRISDGFVRRLNAELVDF